MTKAAPAKSGQKSGAHFRKATEREKERPAGGERRRGAGDARPGSDKNRANLYNSTKLLQDFRTHFSNT